MRDRSALPGDERGPSFGARLRQYREAAGLSQEQLAERAGLSAHAIGALERGSRRQPYVHTVELLATALDLRSSERAELFAAVPRVRLSVLPRPRSATANPARPALPRPTTALLGREREAAAIGSLLGQAGVRLVTLIGPAGVGKTRLALQVAADLVDRFADGVAFVALGPLQSVEPVLAAIATSLGLPDSDDGEPADLLADFLGERRILLVLDNCEHVPALAPLVADLLRASPALTVLATSREPLHVTAEHELPVPGLPVPAAPDTLAPADIAGYAAVRLFVERARAVAPAFALTSSDAATIAAICARLDGLPLAIELAAARVKVLAPQALLRRLDRRLSVLIGGARDAPPRQQSLRDAIQWSYDLLSPPEQDLFRQLAVFAGSWSLELAESVGVGGRPHPSPLPEGEGMGLVLPEGEGTGTPLPSGGMPPLPSSGMPPLSTEGQSSYASPSWREAQRAPPQAGEGFPPTPVTVPVLDVLQSLIDKSLVQLVGGEGEVRFTLLETIREFASERLDASGEADVSRRRHAAGCLALVEAIPQDVWRPKSDEPTGFQRLDTEHDNILAALGWAAAQPDPIQSLLWGGALGWFWWHRAFATEASRDDSAPTLARPESMESCAARSAALFGAAYVAWRRGDYEEANARFEASRDLWPGDATAEAAEVARSARGLALLTRWERLDAAAQSAFEHALTRNRAANDLPGVTASLLQLGWLAFFREDNLSAHAHFAEAEAHITNPRLQSGNATARFGLGWVAYVAGDAASARQHYLASLRLLQASDDALLPYVLDNLGMLAAARDELELAARLASAATSARASSRAAQPTTFIAQRERWLTRARQALGNPGFAAAWTRGAQLSLNQVIELIDELVIAG